MTADPAQRLAALDAASPVTQAMIAQTSRAAQNDEARAAAAARQASLMKRFPNQRLPDPMTLEPGQGLADAREAADVALLAGAPTGQKTDALWALGGRARNLKRPDPAKPRMSALEDTENPLNGRWISSGKELTRLEWAKERAKLRSQARANLLTKDERDAIDSPGLTGKDRPLYTGGMSKEQAARLAEKQSEMKDRIAERRKADVAKNAAAMAASSNPQRARTGMMLLDQLQAGPANAGGMDIVRNAMAVARQALMQNATPAQAMAIFKGAIDTGVAQANADRAATERAADRTHDLTIEEQRGKNAVAAAGARPSHGSGLAEMAKDPKVTAMKLMEVAAGMGQQLTFAEAMRQVLEAERMASSGGGAPSASAPRTPDTPALKDSQARVEKASKAHSAASSSTTATPYQSGYLRGADLGSLAAMLLGGPLGVAWAHKKSRAAGTAEELRKAKIEQERAQFKRDLELYGQQD